MKSDVKALQQSLRQREVELQQLIRQMKSDHLINSKVFKNLEQELNAVKDRLQSELKE